MSIFAQHNTGGYYFTFDCQQWAAMDEEATADWTVVEDSCGYIDGFGSPFARGLFGASLSGKIQGSLPIQVTTAGGLTTVDLPDYLVAVSKNTTSAAIPAGAVVSISVTDALLAGEYQDGDVFSVVDQGTGHFVRLEVTATVGAGDLVISVTGTADFELPAGSILVPIFSVRTPGGGLTDGDYGDVTISGGGTVITIDNNVVTDAKLRDSAALSVIGRSSNSVGDPADIVAGTDGFVLRRSGTVLDFGQVATGGIADGAITDAKLRDSAASSVIGRAGLTAGDPADIIATTSGHVLKMTDTGLLFGTVNTNSLEDNLVTDAKLRDSAGLSVIGRSANSVGDPADIVANNDAEVLRRSGTTLGFGQVATAGIADDAVTYAKLQNISTNNRLLGRATAGAGNAEEITVGTGLQITGTTLSATATGTVDGTGAANQIMYWLDSNTASGDAAFTVDPTNDRMTITGTVAGTGSNNAWLNLNGGSITGTAEVLRASANISTTMLAVLANARNLSNTGNTVLQIEVGGTSAADPFIYFVIPSGVTVPVGLDNSDGDKFKITPGATAPGGTANKGLIMTNDVATLVGINKDAPKHAIDVTGRGRASTGFIGTGVQWTSGSIAFGNGAGTGGSLLVNSITGTDNGMYISFTTGNTPTANGTIFTATYPNAWPASWNTSFVVFSACNAQAATDITKFRTGNRLGNNFTMVANGTLSANTNYQLCFMFWSMDSA